MADSLLAGFITILTSFCLDFVFSRRRYRRPSRHGFWGMGFLPALVRSSRCENLKTGSKYSSHIFANFFIMSRNGKFYSECLSVSWISSFHYSASSLLSSTLTCRRWSTCLLLSVLDWYIFPVLNVSSRANFLVKGMHNTICICWATVIRFDRDVPFSVELDTRTWMGLPGLKSEVPTTTKVYLRLYRFWCISAHILLAPLQTGQITPSDIAGIFCRSPSRMGKIVSPTVRSSPIGSLCAHSTASVL